MHCHKQLWIRAVNAPVRTPKDQSKNTCRSQWDIIEADFFRGQDEFLSIRWRLEPSVLNRHQITVSKDSFILRVQKCVQVQVQARRSFVMRGFVRNPVYSSKR